MRSAALFAITLYQRYLSPHKGYCCAYRSYTGGASCSVLGFRAIRRFGVWDGLALLRARLARCGVAYRRWVQARLPKRRQRGFVDGLCDPTACIPGPGDLAGAACDPCAACDLAEWLCEREQKKDQDKKKGDDRTHLPRFGDAEKEVARRTFGRRYK